MKRQPHYDADIEFGAWLALALVVIVLMVLGLCVYMYFKGP